MCVFPVTFNSDCSSTHQILVMIIKHLSPTDRLEVSLVSKQFACAVQDASNFTLKFDNCHLSDACLPLSTFINPMRHYKRVIFGSNADFQSTIGNFCQSSPLTEVTFNNCTGQTIAVLVDSLRHLTELKELTLNCPNAKFLAGDAFDDDVEPIETVESLFVDGSHIKIEQFESLVRLFPNLKHFGLTCCHDPSLQDDKENLLSCENLVKFINERQLKTVFLEDFGSGILNENLMTVKNLKKFSFSIQAVDFLENNQEITEMGR